MRNLHECEWGGTLRTWKGVPPGDRAWKVAVIRDFSERLFSATVRRAARSGARQCRLRNPQPVPGPAHRFDEGTLCAEFSAQPLHVRVPGARAHPTRRAPDLFQQLRPALDAPRLLQQRREQPELGRGQIDVDAVDLYIVRLFVERERTGGEPAARGDRRAAQAP